MQGTRPGLAGEKGDYPAAEWVANEICMRPPNELGNQPSQGIFGLFSVV